MDDVVTLEDIADLMAELRQMAQRLLCNESNGHSVRPTALVNSALRRCKGADQPWSELTWANHQHLFGAVHREMRRALCDYARKRKAQKRPSLEFIAPEEFDLYRLSEKAESQPALILALEEALEWLSAKSTLLLEVIQHHYFTGMTVAELAQLSKVSEKTVKRRLSEGRLLLFKRMQESLGGG